MNSRILIVEDDSAMGALAMKVLELHGWASQWARSAHEALSLLESVDFDAVITDINMPGMNGLEFCERTTSSVSLCETMCWC